MNYHELMAAFSCCNLGVILADTTNTILEINEIGMTMLHCEERPLGKPVSEVAPFLLCQNNDIPFGNPAFNEYLLPCPAPDPAPDDLPPGTHMLVFRDATKDFRHDMLEHVLDYVSEAITVWDSDCRILMLNDAAAKLEAHLINNILGKHVTSLYEARNDSILVIPELIQKKKPILNLRQDFITHSGKELQILSNNYPILKDGSVAGAASLMEDWTKMDELNKRIIELQRLLIDQSKDTKPKKDYVSMAKYHFNDIIYSCPIMQDTIAKCKQVAGSASSVLFYGETGTGKELFAQSIHNASPRAERPFIAINCAAIPDTLLESILFGSEKGAYTGAERREGLFEQAHTGTLLLDEINSMNIALQSKLLRVLQDGIIRRVGGTRSIQVDVRILSNINIPPMQAIDEGLLRRDLYYRLGVVNITIPPLRERKEDIPLLCKNFIIACNKKLLKNISNLDAATLELFDAYDWPGNARELQHAIEYAMNIIPDELENITLAYVPEHIRIKVYGSCSLSHHASAGEMPTMESALQDTAYRFLRQALLDHDKNISKTAQALGITRQNLQHRMKKNGLTLKDLE